MKSKVLLISLITLFIFSSCGKEKEEIIDLAKPEVVVETEADPRLSWPNTTTTDYPLSSADDDYLVLVNKEFHVTEDYYPEDLVSIERFVEGVGSSETHKMRAVAAEALNAMLDDAEKEGLTIKLRTGFRSFGYQASLFNSYVERNGEEQANKFSARPGESEHQTGLACDLAAKSQDYVLSNSFGESEEGKWVKENCYKYGFILRYIDGTNQKPAPHTGYIYEAWHIRYVGKDAASIMHENPSWTLEEYLDQLKML